MSWNNLASNQTVSCNNLQDAVNTGVFTLNNSIPSSDKEVTKSEAEFYVNIVAIPSKSSNQLVVKSNLISSTPTTSTTTTSPAGTDYLTAVVYGGLIYRSTDDGTTWTGLTAPGSRSWNDVAMSTGGQYQLAADSSGYRWRSIDYGANWTPDANFPYVAPDAVGVSGTGQYQLAVPRYNYIAYSSNYGAIGSWTNSVTGGQEYWGTGDISKNGQYALVGGSSGPVKVSSNYGVDFSNAPGQINLSSANWRSSAVSGTGQHMIVGQYGYSAKVWISSDYGVSFILLPNPPISFLYSSAWSVAAVSSTGQYMLIGEYGGYLYSSSNYGVNWTTVMSSGGVKNWRAASISTTGQYQYAVVQGGGIYFSNNYGVSWNLLTSAGSNYWAGIATSK